MVGVNWIGGEEQKELISFVSLIPFYTRLKKGFDERGIIDAFIPAASPSLNLRSHFVTTLKLTLPKWRQM